MTGHEARRIRLDLGMTQAAMGTWIGFTGDPGRSVRKLEARPTVPPRTAWIIEHLVHDLEESR